MLSFWCQFLDPYHITYHSNIGVQLIVLFELGTSTLLPLSSAIQTQDASPSHFANLCARNEKLQPSGWSLQGLWAP